jgi:translation initiation factor 1
MTCFSNQRRSVAEVRSENGGLSCIRDALRNIPNNGVRLNRTSFQYNFSELVEASRGVLSIPSFHTRQLLRTFTPTTQTTMSKKNKGRADGLVYSTNQDYYNDYDDNEPAAETAPKEKQKLRVKLDSKQRAGKLVTLVEGFSGTTEDLEALGKQLKTKCGTGGSAKDGLIIIQGDYKEKIIAWLRDWGYVLTKG